MNLLAIETSSDACSVALDLDGTVSAEHVVKPREHTQILLPMIRSLLDASRLKPADLNAVVLGNGPGSFIGMRIGASVAQGIAFAAGIQIAPVSSLAAIAMAAVVEVNTTTVAVVQDARMNEVYLGEFGVDDDGLPQLIGEEQICAVGRLPLKGGNPLAAGAGWQRYPELREHNEDQVSQIAEILRPRAQFLLPFARSIVAAGNTIAPDKLLPSYVRGKVAEIPTK